MSIGATFHICVEKQEAQERDGLVCLLQGKTSFIKSIGIWQMHTPVSIFNWAEKYIKDIRDNCVTSGYR